MSNTLHDEMISSLVGKFDDEQLRVISEAFNIAAGKYNITPTSYNMVVYNSTIPQELQYYIADMHVRNLSKLTIKNYAYALNIFFNQVRKPLADIKQNEINAYLYWYQSTRNITGRSKDKLRQVLNSFFTWCCDNEYLTANPMRNIKKGKFTVKPRTALTQLELERVRSSCKSLRDKAIIEFLYSTGCRVSELAYVKKADVDWNTKSVLLFGKGSKYRTSYINAKCEIALMDYLDSRTDQDTHLFATMRKPYRGLTKDGIEAIIDVIEKNSGLQKRITPHIFRHTTATIALANGMPINDIKELLGHTNVSTTMIYAETNQDNVAAEHKRTVI